MPGQTMSEALRPVELWAEYCREIGDPALICRCTDQEAVCQMGVTASRWRAGPGNTTAGDVRAEMLFLHDGKTVFTMWIDRVPVPEFPDPLDVRRAPAKRRK